MQAWQSSFLPPETLWVFRNREDLELILTHPSLNEPTRTRLRQQIATILTRNELNRFSSHYGAEMIPRSVLVPIPSTLWFDLPKPFLDHVYKYLLPRPTIDLGVADDVSDFKILEQALIHAGILQAEVAVAKKLLVRIDGTYQLLVEPVTWPLANAKLKTEMIELFTHSTTFNNGLRCTFQLDAPNISEIARKIAGERPLSEVERLLSDRLQKSGSSSVEVEISEILHPFIRLRANRFCAVDGPNCFNAGLSVNSNLDFEDRYVTPAQLHTLIYKRYRFLWPAEKLRTGDLLVYYGIPDAEGLCEIIHASSYITDSIVFSKNGLSKLSSYVFQNRRDSEAIHCPTGNYRMMAFRIPRDVKDTIESSGYGHRFYPLYEDKRQLDGPMEVLSLVGDRISTHAASALYFYGRVVKPRLQQVISTYIKVCSKYLRAR